MGSWGLGVFDDDFACDIREEYNEARDKGFNQFIASQKARDLISSTPEDSDDNLIGKLALALEQLRRDKRCLKPDADAALQAIEGLQSEAFLSAWEESDRGRRRAILLQARARLKNAPLVNPEAIKDEVAKPKKYRSPSYHNGDIIAIPLGIRGTLGFTRILQFDVKSKLVLLQLYKIISKPPPDVDIIVKSGSLFKFHAFDDGIGRTPDRCIIGDDPVADSDLPTKWYVFRKWENKYFYVPDPFSPEYGQAFEVTRPKQWTTEEEVKRLGAAEGSIVSGGILERVNDICLELAKVGLLSQEEVANLTQKVIATYQSVRKSPKETAGKILKDYRESFLADVGPWEVGKKMRRIKRNFNVNANISAGIKRYMARFCQRNMGKI